MTTIRKTMPLLDMSIVSFALMVARLKLARVASCQLPLSTCEGSDVGVRRLGC